MNERRNERPQERPPGEQEQPEQQHLAGATMTEPRVGGGLSTADMARAMERGGADSTDAVAASADAERRTSTGSEPARETPLFAGNETETFRSRWMEIQTGFVDEPRRAVEQADGLVAEVIQRLAKVFAEERGKLEQQWGQGDDVDTEDLRVALQRYRSFFERLLSA
jgi:hypothetical protein